MDSKLNNQQPNPMRLKTLASDINYSGGNKLLHQFVLDNSGPNIWGRENYINAVLTSMAGTPVNALNGEGYSPLHLAVLKKNLLMVKKLLSCLPNIDVNKKCSSDRDDNTALHLAVKLGHLPIIEELLNSGADLNKRNKNGFTALYLATELGNLTLMEVLISKDADVNAKCECRTGFHYALEFDFLEDLKSFITDSAALDILDYENENILKYSAKSYPRDSLLIGRGVHKYSYKCKGLAPLHLAIESNNLETVKILIIHGADLNLKIRGTFNDTLLHLAAKYANVAIFAFLVNNGLDINAKNDRGCTPLLFAIQNGNIEVMKFLIQSGADLNYSSYHNDTFLHSAAKARELAAVELLVKSGFDINVKNRKGCTPLHCALDYQYHRIKLDIVKFLVSNGADVNAKDQEGNPCFYFAVFANDLEAVKFLVSNGADLDAVNHRNETAHDLAKKTYKGENIVTFLESIGTRCSNKTSLHS